MGLERDSAKTHLARPPPRPEINCAAAAGVVPACPHFFSAEGGRGGSGFLEER